MATLNRPTPSVPSCRVGLSRAWLRVITGAVAFTAGVGIGVPARVAAEAPGNSATTVAPSAGSNHVVAQLQAALDAVVRAGATGVEVQVDDGHHSYHLASGKAQLRSGRALLPSAEVRVGSITKTVVSTVALQLVGEGRLRLSDSVGQWEPDLVPNGRSITVRQLLNHTSGLFDYAQDKRYLRHLFGHPLRPLTPRQLVGMGTSHRPLFAPGAGWSYSNTNYILMGLILRRVTGQPVSQLLEQRIIRPLGLRHTYLPVRSPSIVGYHAHGYLPPSLTGHGYLDFTRLSPTLAWTAGALVSNPHDLRRFYAGLLGGRLLRPDQLTEMEHLVKVGNLRGGYGLGLYKQYTACGPIWGHDGGIPGYDTTAWNDRGGQRGMSIGLATEPGANISKALTRLQTVAACRALGQQPPPPASARS